MKKKDIDYFNSVINGNGKRFVEGYFMDCCSLFKIYKWTVHCPHQTPLKERKSLAKFFKSFGFSQLDANDFIDAYTVTLSKEDKDAADIVAAF